MGFYSRNQTGPIATFTHMVPLVVLIGIPGAGKSTIAQRWQSREPGRIVISTDTIRAQRFGNAGTQGPWPVIWRDVCDHWQRAITAIQAGHQRAVLFDATHANRRDRRRTLQTARQLGFTTIDGYWLNLPLNTCLDRNHRRSRQVPKTIIQRMHRQLQHHPPTLADGFDHLYTLGPDLDNLWHYPQD